jgi:hypothetical protein
VPQVTDKRKLNERCFWINVKLCNAVRFARADLPVEAPDDFSLQRVNEIGSTKLPEEREH